MQETTVTPMMQGLSTSSNNGDEWDPVVDRNIMLEKNRELKKSKYIHSTLVDGTGKVNLIFAHKLLQSVPPAF